ncbi:hypothetical protein [Frigoriflavimonas asaccharolytica]|uniref:Uncharacterized protein n=1 Tax=Frigoriflavimonas asaccharolytica TaxID=2735899 RepID=A0A8J8KB82_9FLAO|nr:hypothetical protein [Frigoriflavimonas asaccharolytica]NRS92299.1 hypothetical protein [Frigoriflavimonas asaccharolytica]
MADYIYRSARDIIFKNFKPSTKSGLSKPVSINENFWNELKISEEKVQSNLTKEEQDFINEKGDSTEE